MSARPGDWYLPKPISAAPNPAETATMYRAQSMLTFGGKRGPILDYPCALQVVRGIHLIEVQP